MTTEKTKPVHTLKLGRVKAAIWANPSEKGGTRYNVTVTRLFKLGDHWRDSPSFGREEIPLAMKVLDQAHTWIHEQAKNT